MWDMGIPEKGNRELHVPRAVMDLVCFNKRQRACVAGMGSKGERVITKGGRSMAGATSCKIFQHRERSLAFMPAQYEAEK